MRRVNLLLVSLMYSLMALSVVQAAGLPGAAPSAARPAVRVVSLATLESSLPATPVIAGFDIDDTVIFSSPGFYFGEHNDDGPGGTNRYGADFLKNPQFWKDLNQYHDRYSMKKKSGEDLVRMHKRRGDTIVFITKRICYDDDALAIQKRLDRMFDIRAKVYCTDEKPKTPKLTETGVDMYYGDSDSDIEYAFAVQGKKVRAIRVERNPASSYTGNYHPGSLGEEVLGDSAY